MIWDATITKYDKLVNPFIQIITHKEILNNIPLEKEQIVILKYDNDFIRVNLTG